MNPNGNSFYSGSMRGSDLMNDQRKGFYYWLQTPCLVRIWMIMVCNLHN